MARNTKTETYYVISSRVCLLEQKIITCINETDGELVFEFIASFEQHLDKELISLLKKINQYSFTTSELAFLENNIKKQTISNIKSILNENNINIDDIDLIALQPLSLSNSVNLDIAKDLYQEFKTVTISNLDLSIDSGFFKALTYSKNIENKVLIDLDETFNIYQSNSKSILIDSSMGYKILTDLASNNSIEQDKVSLLVAHGKPDMAILNKFQSLANDDNPEKELLKLISYSSLNVEDKLATIFLAIKALLLQKLVKFDKNTHIVVIGNTRLVEDLNQSVKNVFINTSFLRAQSQRQNTLINEQLAFYATKKYLLLDYNNGVKIS